MTRFEVKGVGFRPGDSIRIVDLGSDCETAPPPKDLCPDVDSENVDIPICQYEGVRRIADFPLSVLKTDGMQCDELNANCKWNAIELVEVTTLKTHVFVSHDVCAVRS